jgi:hypothetical protein
MKKFQSYSSVIATAVLNNILPNSQEFDRNALKELIAQTVGNDLVDVSRVALYIQGKLDMPELAYKSRISGNVCSLIRVDMIRGVVDYSYENTSVLYFKTEEAAKDFFLTGQTCADNSVHQDETYRVKGTFTKSRTGAVSIDTWNLHAIDGADDDIDKK